MIKVFKSHFAEAFRVSNLFGSMELNFRKTEAMSLLIQKVSDNKGKVLCFGSGVSAHTADYCRFVLQEQGVAVFFCKDTDVLEQNINGGDLLLLFSDAGVYPVLREASERALALDALVVLLAGSEAQNNDKVADLTIFAPETSRNCRTVELQIKIIHALGETIKKKK